MYAFVDRVLPLGLALIMFAGCAQTSPTQSPNAAIGETKTPGVTTNSGGDTRGTVLYQPSPSPAKPVDPYAAISGKFVLAQRQKFAWELAEIDLHAHQQAENAYPVPDASSPRYSKQLARQDAERQAEFNVYLLEKYHARFCNQFHLSYDQLALIIQEGRDKNWPLPPVPKE